MTEIEASAKIDRPAGEVFDYVSDMANNPQWQKGQKSCEWTSEPPIAIGSTYDQVAVFAGQKLLTSFEVAEFEPGERIRIVSTSGSMPIDVTRVVTPTSDSSCEVTVLVKGEPPKQMRMLGWLVDRLVKRNINADYDQLKTLLEADQPPPPQPAPE